MAGMGPPPKDPSHRRRRNATVAMTPLPASGRQGRPPAWPLGADIVTQAKLRVARDRVEDLEGKRAAGFPVSEQALTRALERVAVLETVVEIQAASEAALWRELWRTPQAVEWERLRWTREVAQYIRWKVLAESGDMDAAKEARQLADRLGLTPLALLRLRWTIADRPATNTAAPAASSDASTDGQPASVTALSSRRSRLTG